ncbi:MAG: hypothetical protein HC880_00610 [Bacteroidia bacterium]|nr:hypothetical protein [Bacteroidia bacterium]
MIDNELGTLPSDKSQSAKNKRTNVRGEIDMYVSQEVCVHCTAGLNPDNETLGPLLQFSLEFPNVKLTITNADSQEVITILNGVRQ